MVSKYYCCNTHDCSHLQRIGGKSLAITKNRRLFDALQYRLSSFYLPLGYYLIPIDLLYPVHYINNK